MSGKRGIALYPDYRDIGQILLKGMDKKRYTCHGLETNKVSFSIT